MEPGFTAQGARSFQNHRQPKPAAFLGGVQAAKSHKDPLVVSGVDPRTVISNIELVVKRRIDVSNLDARAEVVAAIAQRISKKARKSQLDSRRNRSDAREFRLEDERRPRTDKVLVARTRNFRDQRADLDTLVARRTRVTESRASSTSFCSRAVAIKVENPWMVTRGDRKSCDSVYNNCCISPASLSVS